MNWLNDELEKILLHLTKEKVLSHQDNEQLKICVLAMAKFNEIGNELRPHLSYFPDLAHSNYFLFSNLMKWLDEQRSTKTTNSSLKRRRILSTMTNFLIWKEWKNGETLEKYMELKRHFIRKQNVMSINLFYVEQVTNLLTQPHSHQLALTEWS